jgi:hypothetical protein
LFVHQIGIGRKVARALWAPPFGWSPLLVTAISPPLIVWGLLCLGFSVFSGSQVDLATATGAEALLLSFPFVMMVAGVLLIVTGRTINSDQSRLLPVGILVAAGYVLIGMFNGKRSHALIGVLASVCAFYVARQRRPSWPVLLSTALTSVIVVSIAIGWRNAFDYERSFTGFLHFVGDFQVAKTLESLNITDEVGEVEQSYETVEYGGFLLMMDTVPARSDYDYGVNYIRVVSTFIPRLIWPSKPVYGRSQWISAWIAGSEMERDPDFTGPAIGILGATQLNGGAVATLIVLACVAILLRTAYEYLRLHADVTWVQFWWSITYYNAWFMVVNDDPLVWFYYNWGFTTFPIVVVMWWCSKRRATPIEHEFVAQPVN